MDGIIWLFLALLVALVTVCVALRDRRKHSVEPIPRQCANCETPMSLRRISFFRSYFLLGTWECPHCGARTGAGIWMSSGPL